MRRRKSKKGLIGGLALLAGAAVVAGFVYTSPKFERTPPRIDMPTSLYWNGKKPLELKFSDDTALRDYRIFAKTGAKSGEIAHGTFDEGTKSVKLKLPYDKKLFGREKEVLLTVSVRDASLWNFFKGNETTATIRVHIDRKRPNVNIVANSRMIAQGGSALVVFSAEDENLDKLYVEANGHRFKPQPYKKEGYYATLVAWPFTNDTFDAKVVATDKAGNVKSVHIPFYHKNSKYRTSYIRATDRFIDGKISDLAASDPEYADIDDKLEKLRAVNEKMREKNEALIHRLSKHVSDEMLQKWEIKRFYPLKNGKKVASFGDHRYYYYGDKSNIVSESYHVGYDLASVKMADIVASNPGKVVFAGENGIYGNMPLIDHGLGLYTLYGHCSKLLVKEGDEVKRGQVIAKTGMTGLALGDHLHFGILVQGIEVRPVEWFDPKWIRTFIDDVFKEADAVIASQKE
jgi:murein DD-endopeptidase MepM/ murein hydrolase activator NlpD